MKQALHNEIKANAEAIASVRFLEESSNKTGGATSTNLMNSIKEQYKLSRKQSAVHKYALKWLNTVRARRKEREEKAFFKQDQEPDD